MAVVLVAMEIAGGMFTVGRLGTSAGGVLVSVNDRTLHSHHRHISISRTVQLEPNQHVIHWHVFVLVSHLVAMDIECEESLGSDTLRFEFSAAGSANNL